MGDNQFIGEIRLFPYNFIPEGWYSCNGQQVSISSQAALFAVIGAIYGGDSRTYFNLPNLNGEAAMGASDVYALGQKYGATTATLTSAQIPSHTHTIVGTIDPASTATPNNTMYPAQFQAVGGVSPLAYTADTAFPASQVAMSSNALPATGNGTSPNHSNVQPNLVLSFCICWDGYFPTYE